MNEVERSELDDKLRQHGWPELIRTWRPISLTNGAMVEMDSEGNFWGCDAEDGDLLPPQGPQRTLFVLENLVSPPRTAESHELS